MDLVEITFPEFDVEFFITYATAANFTGQPVYKNPYCYLHRNAALCLKKAITLAAAQGLRFKIFDAFRPQEAQEILWNHTPDPDFLADPRKGSAHSRGVAVDLTLINSKGEELDMGTAFDAFTTLSYHGEVTISKEAQHNRLLLLGLMSTAGWDFYQKEWWHYQLFHAKDYPLCRDNEAGTKMM